eukprot:1157433-Pelagomonas_calceolata.AAC.1
MAHRWHTDWQISSGHTAAAGHDLNGGVRQSAQIDQQIPSRGSLQPQTLPAQSNHLNQGVRNYI